jgi:hypothetical protein
MGDGSNIIVLAEVVTAEVQQIEVKEATEEKESNNFFGFY